MAAKGTVTPMSSVFTHEDTHAAEQRVNAAIAGKLRELDRLRGFLSDNANLINLVKRLPDQLHHQIMVPFGKAAFFPGKLVHTNEFMVLLGEGYYAETTSKQAVEILKRRAKTLESQVSSLNAVVQDLEAEASFFRATMSEIADGIMEIREDYVEESCVESESGLMIKPVSLSVPESGKEKVSDGDEEFARLMARLDVLEKEELEAEAESGLIKSVSDDDEANDESDEDGQSNADFEGRPDERYLESKKPPVMENREKPEYNEPQVQATEKDSIVKEITRNQHRSGFKNELNCTSLATNYIPVPKDELPSDGNTSIVNMKKPVEKVAARAVVQNKDPVPTSGFDSQKAFTGSIIERNSVETSSKKQTPPSSQTYSQSSKPVSRFKMQRK